MSVVIPTRNRVELLGAAVESVRAQSLREIEIVVVDDGSSDGTQEWLEAASHRDPRIRVLRGAGNGPATARNLGLAAVAAPWVAFLDDDDLWRNTALETLLDHGKLTGWVCACHTLRFRSPDPGLRPADIVARAEELEASLWPTAPLPGRVSLAELLTRPLIPLHAMLAPRGSLRDTGGFDERLQAAEDYNLWLRLAARRPVDVIPEPLALYRWHGHQARRDQLFHSLQTRRALELFLEDHPDLAADVSLARLARRHRARLFREEGYELILQGQRYPAVRACWHSLLLAPGELKALLFMGFAVLPGACRVLRARSPR